MNKANLLRLTLALLGVLTPKNIFSMEKDDKTTYEYYCLPKVTDTDKQSEKHDKYLKHFMANRNKNWSDIWDCREFNLKRFEIDYEVKQIKFEKKRTRALNTVNPYLRRKRLEKAMKIVQPNIIVDFFRRSNGNLDTYDNALENVTNRASTCFTGYVAYKRSFYCR